MLLVLESRRTVTSDNCVKLSLCLVHYVGIERHGEDEVLQRRGCLERREASVSGRISGRYTICSLGRSMMKLTVSAAAKLQVGAAARAEKSRSFTCLAMDRDRETYSSVPPNQATSFFDRP